MPILHRKTKNTLLFLNYLHLKNTTIIAPLNTGHAALNTVVIKKTENVIKAV